MRANFLLTQRKKEKAKENENDCEIASKMKEERRTRPSDW